jgi:hypothetical protein
MAGLEHLLQSRRGTFYRGQVPVEAFGADDLVDRLTPLRPVLFAGVKSPPIGERNERRVGMRNVLRSPRSKSATTPS